MIERCSARAVILNSKNEVLLYEFVQNRIQGDVAWWVFPGGGLEDDETFEQAVYREIEEETGVITKEPIKWIWERNILLNSKKGPMLSYERYYLIRLDIEDITLDNFTENEKRTFKNYKWFSLIELKSFIGNLSVSQTYELIKMIILNKKKEYPIKIGV